MMAGEAVTSTNMGSVFVQNPCSVTTAQQDHIPQPPLKRKRNLPGTPDPDAEVVALSPRTLLATNRFVCEICGKGFQRDQNLQLHRRGHNLPWRLRQRAGGKDQPPKKRVYVCPEPSCVHHHPSRALGDLTGIKKHFCRKHGEKKWKCEKCSKKYAVQSDWKAHSKTCGTREYRCDCGTLFSRRDSFVTHRAFCDALAEEAARISAAATGAVLDIGTPNSNYFSLGGASGSTARLSSSSILSQGQHYSPAAAYFNAPPDLAPFDQGLRQQGFSLWSGEIQDPTKSNVDPLSSGTDGSCLTADLHHTLQQGSPALYGGPGSAIFPPARSSSLQQQLDAQWPWAFGGDKIPSPSSTTTSSGEVGCSSNKPSAAANPAGATGSLLAGLVPSICSSMQQRPHTDPTSSAAMSATALLQKAAQMGAASSTEPSMMAGAVSVIGRALGFDQNRYGDGLLTFAVPPPPSLGGTTTIDLGSSAGTPGDHNDMMALTQMGAYCSMAGRGPGFAGSERTKDGRDGFMREGGGKSGPTRDFLGVGMQQQLCPTSSIVHGWI